MDVSNCNYGIISDKSLDMGSPGFSLIEVLITLLITSVGLLSLAVLQIQGLRAVMRTHAVAFATEMVEQLRTSAGHFEVIPLPSPDLDHAQLQDWQTRIQLALPEGSGTVEKVDLETNIGVAWDDHGAAQQFTVSISQ